MALGHMKVGGGGGDLGHSILNYGLRGLIALLSP